MLGSARRHVAGLVFALAAWLLLPQGAALADDPDFIALGAGAYDINGTEPEAQFRAEYRFQDRFLFLKPMLGLLVTSEGSFYGYGGIRIDLYLSPRWVFTPNFAIGGFAKGNGKDLGSALEFKTGAEIDYRFDSHARLGIAYDHISNAGITKHNPGENGVIVYYALPFGELKP